ncbi:hypothetical protein LJC10_05910 [Selenomonadales bacterium OttesenSCG-928-I06]|nr:hypothetical protein [Selenomonadales bacterium OttesenSCG-928-I06]
MNDFTITIIAILLSALLSGIVVFIISWRIRKNEIKTKTKGYLILLTTELNAHLFWIRNLYSKDHDISAYYILKKHDTEWNNTKYYLSETLTNQQFFDIHDHYLDMEALRESLKLAEATKVPLPEDLIQKHILIASKAYDIVYNLSKIKELAKENSTSDKEG